ncbi:hypothetical protein [Caulobacter sp. UC70_42]|uniref:hypothetical protein n=1 Tax=Caulobacter sp. UC70_42 TaxID=3374551 RepID=UPI003757A20E
MKPAFSNFGSNTEKQFTMIRPLIKAPAIINPALEVLTDYREAVPTSIPTTEFSSTDVGDANDIRYDWTSTTAIGYVATPRMRVSVLGNQNVDRVSFDGIDLILTETGGDFIITAPNLPLDVDVQLIGFDLMFIQGGPL